MIYVYTGKPGAGKTLSALADFVGDLRKSMDRGELRPAYVSGVDGFNPDHPDLVDLSIQILDDPEEWEKLPDGSAIFVDEVQRIFRPRRSGSQVPHYQAALETHRHRGLDFVFTTQGMHLLDNHVHPLVDRHIHLHRGNHREGCWRYEWAEAKRQPRGQTAKDCAEVARRVPFRKDVYDWYKSAEVHTHKRQIPWRLLGKLMFPAACIGLAIFFGMRSDTVRGWFGAGGDDPESALRSEWQGPPAQSGGRGAGKVKREDMTWEQLVTPEVDGMPWTAPIFRPLLASAEDFPRPQCVILHARTMRGNYVHDECRCYSPQATRLEVPADVCKSIVEAGWFDPSRPAGGGNRAPARRARLTGTGEAGASR